MLERQCNMDAPNGFSCMNVNKMIESSRNWNLANDVELLKCLEKFSENIINNASLSLSSMDNLEDSLNETFLKVRTVANKFQAIADNQFIENRVQEEEDFVLANDEKDAFENQPSTESSKAQILECIRDCQNALGMKFETVQLSGIDSDDEMANNSPVVLVPKNAYKERRLPHLIGGEQFKKDETLGLGPTVDSTDESVESDKEIDETDRLSYHSSNVPKDIIKQSDEDIDETDRSSYHSSIAAKDIIKKVGPFKQFEKSVSTNENSEWNLSSKEYIPEPPPFRSTYLSYDPPRLDSEPPPLPSDMFSNMLLPEAPILYEPPDSLCEDDPDPTSLEPPVSNGFEDDDDEIFPTNKTEKEEASSPEKSAPSNSSVSREQLLSGRNFASFKEDLARVLSGAKMPRKTSSFDSDGSKSDLSSPAQGSTSKEVCATEDFSPPPVTSSHSSPANRSVLLSSASAYIASPSEYHESTAVTLPSVSTNVLESLAKGRAKVKGKRRPPSRKHRQASLDAESPGVEQNNSAHSEDASVHESSSTQPGSNILSPATDEEDLFVLPAFDLPSDPPNRGLFFGNSLLSPGTTIDDGGQSNSPLFPPDPLMDKPSLDPPLTQSSPPRIAAYGSSSHSVSSEKLPPIKSVVEMKTESKASDSSNFPQADLFSSNIGESVVNKKQKKTAKPQGFVIDNDLFSETSSKNDGLSEKLDIFPSTNNEIKLSSSPLLFTDLDEPSVSSKTSSKVSSKTSLRSGLKWDFLGSDDFGENLFRSQKKESLGSPSSEQPKPSKTVGDKQEQKPNTFPPSLGFDRSGGGNLFGDDSNYSSSDIFSGSSTFMGLSLPKSSKDSLFASDDDEDDESLFKSSKSSSTLKTPVMSIKPQGSSQGGSHSVPKNSSSRELVNDPLSSMDQE